MEEGWNYFLWNNGGKNVYFFLDTNHTDLVVQQNLVDEGRSLIDREPIPIFFSEGISKDYDVNFKMSIDMWKRYCIEKEGYWSANTLFSYYMKRKNINSYLYGVDNDILMKNQAKTIRDFYKTFKFFRKKGWSDSSDDYLEKLKKKMYKVCEMRSMYAVRTIDSVMDLNDFDRSILMYGAAHSEEILEGLLEKDIGVAFYLPKKGRRKTFEEDMNYGLSL